MANYSKTPKCKLSRREGVDLLLKSNIRALDSKCKADKPPGQHGARRGRITDYKIQLRMKQLIKCYYGVLERQFRRYYELADRRKGSTGENLLKILESRLDNVIYRLGFANTRAQARQLVSHKAVLVNGKVVNIPSYQLAPKDVITIRDKAKKQARIIDALELAAQGQLVDWLTLNSKEMSGIYGRHPVTGEFPPEFKIHLVIELYSK